MLANVSGLYPLKGIYYFLAHPFLYPLFRARLLFCLLLSLFVFTNLFVWTYLPQVAFLSLFQGRLAWLNGAVLVLGEGAAIVALLFEAFFVDASLVDVFDAVLVHERYGDLVAQSRVLRPDGEDPVRQLGRPMAGTEGSMVYSPFSLRQVVEFVFFLPLNFVPVFGTPAFLLLTGARAGPLHHWRYFRLLGLSKKARSAAIRRGRLPYTWFGTVALVLQLVPMLSMVFLMTTAAGSALWVTKLEERRRNAEAVVEWAQPEYVDNPI